MNIEICIPHTYCLSASKFVNGVAKSSSITGYQLAHRWFEINIIQGIGRYHKFIDKFIERIRQRSICNLLSISLVTKLKSESLLRPRSTNRSYTRIVTSEKSLISLQHTWKNCPKTMLFPWQSISILKMKGSLVKRRNMLFDNCRKEFKCCFSQISFHL